MRQARRQLLVALGIGFWRVCCTRVLTRRFPPGNYYQLPSATPIQVQSVATNHPFFPSGVWDRYLDLIGMAAFLSFLIQGRGDIEVSLSALD